MEESKALEKKEAVGGPINLTVADCEELVGSNVTLQLANGSGVQGRMLKPDALGRCRLATEQPGTQKRVTITLPRELVIFFVNEGMVSLDHKSLLVPIGVVPPKGAA